MASSFTESQVKFHRPVDSSDPGFTIAGFKLHWVSARVSENNPGRIWAIIRKSKLPKKVVDHIETYNPAAFNDGETYRRGDLCLAFASKDAYDQRKKENAELREQQEKMIARQNVYSKSNQLRGGVSELEQGDATAEVMKQFVKDKK